MKLGIVGHEGAKFTSETEAKAREAIRELIQRHKPELVVSGRCPLGGIDIWAVEEAKALGIPTKEFAPDVNQWDPPGRYGFKARNLDIATSDLVACLVVAELPATYRGMRFKGCYHCKGRNPEHVKSGGCWTAWRARAREWVIV